MSGKLIIGGKAWGEFENAKRTKGNIEISGYRSYGGTHSVRMVDQPKLNENQQQVLDWLKWSFEDQGNSSMDAIYLLRLGEAIDSVLLSYMALTKKDQTEVLQAFAQWALEQEG
ncbi:hypothetical protein NG885_08250 [Enterococcus faecium]|uniref:hypothetical protein n=1 Tax=Enterococcus faecium TaxID=1352 RepID=UPI0020909B5F|nr:hypothetical protein [Enterococcus faecium]MCO5531659.1 hypothetical protein [Enterococcus faecium]